MAEEHRSLYVYGLPTDVDPERLRDKLLIHFLRGSNGGGEVTSVTIINATPGFALVTFEESRVAQRVLRHHPHILELDGRICELSLSLPSQEPLSLNKVILDMAVTVDCSQLPQDVETLNVLRSKFPGLCMKPGLLQQTCTLQGIYSEVQGALSYLQKFFSLNHHSSRSEYSEMSGENSQAEPSKKWEEIESREHQKWRSLTHQSPGLHMGDLSPSSVGIEQDRYGLQGSTEDLSQLEKRPAWTEKSNAEEGAECKIDETDLESLSLIMEADVFAYLQTTEEYLRILRYHEMQVVHVTSEGVTTLYLQAEVTAGCGAKQNMRQAYKELRQLYQERESCLRKDKLQMNALYLPGGLNAALKNVQSVLPNVLLSYDQDNVYIVGERSEVSQAKQMLLLGMDQGVMGSLRETQETFPTSTSSSPLPSPKSLEKGHQVKRKSELHTPVTPKLIGSGTERKGEGGKEYKLAARFKSSGLGGVGTREEVTAEPKSVTSKKDMLTSATISQSTPSLRYSLGTTGVLGNELTWKGADTFRVTGPNYTGEDVLFRNPQPLSSVNTFGTIGITSITSKSKLTTSSGFTPAMATGVKTLSNTSVNAPSARNTEVKMASSSTTMSVITSKSTLRRANSFSGQPYKKEQVQKNQVTAGSMINTRSHQRTRSNSLSLSDPKPSEDLQVSPVEAELTVSLVMWNYMKQAYCDQLDDMKSGLYLSEEHTDSRQVRVILKGKDSSKVGECHRKLQSLVAMVATDFCVQELHLAELGVDEKDDLFEACCSNVRSRFCKVVLHNLKDRVFLLGPKLLCSKVSGVFKDVFPGQQSNSLSEVKTLHGATNPSLSGTLIQTSGRSEKAGPSVLSFQDTNQMLLTNSSLTKTKSGGQSTKQKSTVLERLEKPKSAKDALSKTNTSPNSQSADTKEEGTVLKNDEQAFLPLTAHKKEDTSMTLKQSSLLTHMNPSGHCVCGARGTDVKRTSCGVTLCPVCLPLHSHCRVCGEEELCSQKKTLEDPEQDKWQNQVQEDQEQEHPSGKERSKELKGIQGTMTCTELPLSLGGYARHMTAKITYCIPDGIQGETDPCPGSSFQGGLFEAYLPLSPKGRGLLPCLEKAFQKGLTFTIAPGKKVNGGGAKVTWSKIPHKTKMEGGKGSNAYPDSSYLNRLSEALLAHGIEGVPAITQDKAKS